MSFRVRFPNKRAPSINTQKTPEDKEDKEDKENKISESYSPILEECPDDLSPVKSTYVQEHISNTDYIYNLSVSSLANLPQNSSIASDFRIVHPDFSMSSIQDPVISAGIQGPAGPTGDAGIQGPVGPTGICFTIKSLLYSNKVKLSNSYENFVTFPYIGDQYDLNHCYLCINGSDGLCEFQMNDLSTGKTVGNLQITLPSNIPVQWTGFHDLSNSSSIFQVNAKVDGNSADCYILAMEIIMDKKS